MKQLLRRQVAMPVWSLALIVLAFVGIIGATAEPGEENGTEVATARDREPTDTTATTTLRTTTTAAPTTTTVATTTTTAPTTTTEPAVTQQSFQAIFDAHRPDFLAILQDDNNIETVDKFIYESGSGMIVLDVTSAWASPDNQVEGAWTIMRGMAALWQPGGPFPDSFTPGLRLVNSGTRHECDSTFMLQLARTEAGRQDWAAACR